MNFQPEEEPTWRNIDNIKTSAMLKEIHQHQTWYMDISPDCKVLKMFISKSTIDWVFNSNHLELEGTLDKQVTKDLCKKKFSCKQDKEIYTKSLSTKEKVTLKTLKALNKMYQYRKEMKEYDEISPKERLGNNDFLFLTEDVIKHVHKIILPTFIKKSVPPGVYRIYHAYPSGYDDHFYCDPKDIQHEMEKLIDQYNNHVYNLPNSSLYNKMEFDVMKMRMIYNLSAWILFHFVNIHPFSDGNGRMCRLLANSVLFNECPFPVFLKGPYTLKKARKIYIDSIVQCRNSDDQTPSLLSAFIIESCLEQWRKFKRIYDNYKEIKSIK